MSEFDKFSESYDKLLKRNVGIFAQDTNYFSKYKAKLIKTKIKFNPKKILEYGCGIGNNLYYLGQEFPKSTLFGYDPSSKSIKIAEKKNKSTKFYSSKEEIENEFDLILIICVLHHIKPKEWNRNISFIKEKLSSNGTLIVIEHNPLNPITRRLVATCPFDKDAVLIRKSKLKNILKRSNFKFIESEYCLFFPQKFSFLNVIERYLKNIPIGGQYLVMGRK